MGIPGLTGFIEKRFNGWKQEEIKKKVVIDGGNLTYHLYEGLDCFNGGQCPQYREAIVEFFQILKKSDIDPIVVLDGIDYKHKKRSTVVESRRRQNKRQGTMLPILGYKEFNATLLELGILFVVADGEADVTVCQLANHYSCPVLANDSDYCMFNLKGGYIPFKNLELDRAGEIEPGPIKAKVFHIEAFTKQFKYGDISLRLIIPTVFGNDFLYPYQSPQLDRHIGVGTPLRPDHQGLSAVTKYASQFTNLGEFATQFSHSSGLLTNCQESVRYYDSKVTASFDQLRDPKMTELRKRSGERIPEWLMSEFRDGHVSTFVIRSLALGKCTKSVGVYALCKPLRQYIYGLIGVESVEENVRLETQEDGAVRVHAVYSVDDQQLPTLNLVTKLDHTTRKDLLYSLLSCNPVDIEKVSDKWRLVVASVIFWANKAEKITEREVKALLYTLVLCSSKSPGLLPQIQLHQDQEPERITVVYFYIQWQCCYLTADNLNVLLMKPLEYISPALLYDGQMVVELYFTGKEPDLDETQKMLYSNLCCAVSSHTVLELDPHHEGHLEETFSPFEHPNRYALLNKLDPVQ